MSRDSYAALLLALGSAAILVTMGVHPTGADVVHGATSGGSNALVRGAHGLAILSLPPMLTGTAWLSWRLRTHAMVAATAWSVYLLGIVAVLVAAVASGFLSPAAAERAARQSGDAQQLAMQLFHFSGLVNQAFAKVYVALSAVAIALWSVAMRGERAFPVGLRALGVVVGVALLVGLFSGHLRLDIHGFGAVVIAQTIWVGWTAWCLHGLEAAAGATPSVSGA